MREWPQKELDGLASREVSGVKVILPICHNITTEEIKKHSPVLADRIAVNSKNGLDHVVTELLRVIEEPTSERLTPTSEVASPPLRGLNLRWLKRWEVISLIVTILACIGTWLAVPQIQKLYQGVQSRHQLIPRP